MSSTPASRPTPTLALAAVIVVGLALRIWEAVESSLWLDELHTLSHAAQPDLRALLDSVAAEVHTPLFFLAVHLVGDWELGAWLRAIPLLSSLLTLVPLWALTAAAARSAGASAEDAGRSTLVAAAVFAWVPYQVHWATELRPYAWVALFSAGAVWSAFSRRGPALARFALFFLCVLAGLFTHRIMALTVFSVGAARLISFRREGLLHLGWLILAGALAVAPFVPWLLGFASSATSNRLEYQESVGGYELRPQLVKEVLALPVRVFVPFLGALGGGWATLARVGAGLFFGALALGAVERLRQRQRIGPPGFLTRGLALFALVNFLVITALSIWTWDRVPLQYYAPLAWLLPLFVAELLGPLAGRLGSAARVGALGGALVLGVAQAGGSCTEDMRAGVATVRAVGAELEAAGRAPIYTALLSQPSAFEHRLPYLAYAPELDTIEPEQGPMADPRRPLVVLRRGVIGLEHPSWEPLLAGRVVGREVHVDAYLTVFVLDPAP